jgi:ABC-2 type transport system permease protein
MNPTQIFKIARREFLTRVTSRAFIIMTVLVPAFLGFYMFSIPLLTRSRSTEQRFAIVDAGTGLGAALGEQLASIERPRIVVAQTVTVAAADAAVRDRFNRELRARTLDGYLVLDRQPATPVRVRYYGRETANPQLVRELRFATQSIALGRLLAGTGIDAAELRKIQVMDVDTVTVSDRGERQGGVMAAMASTMALTMLVYVAVLINGQGMAMAIVEEKSSRLVEVILGAVTATEFMAGKILGVLASGLTQLAIWIAVAVVSLLQAAPLIAAGSDATGFDVTTVLNARMIMYFAIFFALGYALYSVFFAIVAVTCTSTEEMTQSMMAASMPMVLAVMIAMNVVANPATPLTRVLSLVPFLTPLVMMARVNILMPPLWEVWLGIGLLAASTVAVAWMAAKIFRYALLMTGKRPTLPELLAVVRAR